MSSKRKLSEHDKQQKAVLDLLVARQEKTLTTKVRAALEKDSEHQSLLKEERDVRAEQHVNNLNITKKSGALEARRQMVVDLEKAVKEHEEKKVTLMAKHKDINAKLEASVQRVMAQVRVQLRMELAQMLQSDLAAMTSDVPQLAGAGA